MNTSDDWSIKDTGFLTELSNKFTNGVTEMKSQLDSTIAELKENPSDPSLLAAYQSALSEYNLFRTAQSNAVKAYKDIGSSIITNFKN